MMNHMPNSLLGIFRSKDRGSFCLNFFLSWLLYYNAGGILADTFKDETKLKLIMVNFEAIPIRVLL